MIGATNYRGQRAIFFAATIPASFQKIKIPSSSHHARMLANYRASKKLPSQQASKLTQESKTRRGSAEQTRQASKIMLSRA